MPPTLAYGERLRPLERHQEGHRCRGRSRPPREGEIWWVRLGKNIGYETYGKSREFTRPVIILKKYNQYSFLALPLTTAPKPNPYRLPIGMVDGKLLRDNLDENGGSNQSLKRRPVAKV